MFDHFVVFTLKKLTQFMSLISFYTPLNHQDFLLFSWGIIEIGGMELVKKYYKNILETLTTFFKTLGCDV